MRIFFVALGLVSLGLGAVGTILPILPTTPLLLLAGFCFAKSSNKLNDWFKGTKLYKDNLASFFKGQGMTQKAKLRVMGTVTAVMTIAFIVMKNTTVGRICLVVVWLAHVIAFAFFVKTCEEEKGGDRP